MSETLILIVEDDMAIATGLAMNVELEGFTSCIAQSAEDATLCMQSKHLDLILLDIGLPKKDGFAFLQELADGADNTPVIVLSARMNESVKVRALQLGADDYVTKPFALAELMARISAVLRRVQAGQEHAMQSYSFGLVQVHAHTRIATQNKQEVSLTHLEFELLLFFVRHPNEVLHRDRLLQEVWGTQGSRRTVDNFVAQLRSKLEETPETPKHFLTVRGSGYRFVKA